MRRSPANSTNRSLAAFGKLQHIRRDWSMAVLAIRRPVVWRPRDVGPGLMSVACGSSTYPVPHSTAVIAVSVQCARLLGSSDRRSCLLPPMASG